MLELLRDGDTIHPWVAQVLPRIDSDLILRAAPGESPLHKCARALLRLGAKNRYADLETAAVKLADLTGTPLPAHLQREWHEALWLDEGHRATTEVLRNAAERTPLMAIAAALKDDEILRKLSRLVIARRASFELLLLKLTAAGALAKSVSALRRSVDAEVAKVQRQQRANKMTSQRPQAAVVGDDAARYAAEVLIAWAEKNRPRLWGRSLARGQACRNQARNWVGRWDGSQAVLGIERKVVDRVLIDAGFNPVAVMDQWHRKGWLMTDTTGAPRWQARIGSNGQRRWLIGLRLHALE